MRSPEHRKPAHPRAGKNFEVDLSLRYLSPGAFTVLPPDGDPPPDPPTAPAPYSFSVSSDHSDRLTPTSRRHKNQSFSIIAEPTSRNASRSPSPTGRVSPFRGRGFNPAGSRHNSPAPSPPPPEDLRAVSPSPHQRKPHVTRIPTLSRRGSSAAFGDKVTHHDSSPNKRKKLHSQFSQSLTNIANGGASSRPPPSPRKPAGVANSNAHSSNNRNAAAFQRLSPIVGSSPEPSQSQSSPSRIPKSRSQPPSRKSSPTRLASRPPHRTPSRPVSRTPSRNTSREPSPSKLPLSPSKPTKNYRNIQAKVNSFNSKPKPKVPPKPENAPEKPESSNSKPGKTVHKPRITRNESVNKLRTTPRNNNNNNNNSNNNTLKNNKKNNNNNNNNKPTTTENKTSSSKQQQQPERKEGGLNNNYNSDTTMTETGSNRVVESSGLESSSEEDKKKSSPVRLMDLLQPSTTAVVSSTTTTVTKPLKIDAKLEGDKSVSPMVDGRVLSATSVSNAMNRMNDSVLDTQTLMKDHHGLSNKLSPAANAIISMSNETNPALDTKNATAALPTIGAVRNKPDSNNLNNNHVSSTGILDSRLLEREVQRNMSKLISPDHVMGNSVQKSVNERILDARTVVAGDPIRITVKEKPADLDVQSGNVRLPVNATNGLSERPGLPPPQHQNESPPESHPPPKTNVCTRLFSSCRNKFPCKCCKNEPPEVAKRAEENEGKTGCFNCRKKRDNPVRINIDQGETKPKFWDRVNCCSKNRVGDTGGCFSKKRKDSWVERSDSILSDLPPKKSKCSKRCCNNFFRKLFCINRCCKKKITQEEMLSRRASTMSKKKSLTPTTLPPPEDTKPKIDLSLVEHTSHMKGAIPVLPVCLAWFCLVLNVILPGTGTIFSGMFCLCIGKPRFSQKDGPKPRIGAFIIDLVIGIGQCFTVLFCLVGWGWSIWWGVIMVKIAKKHQKLKLLAANNPEEAPTRPGQSHHNHRDPERGS